MSILAELSIDNGHHRYEFEYELGYMGIGFYLMVAAAVVMYKVAEADKRRGWLWSGIVVCTIMLLARFTDVGLAGILIGFCLTFLAMFIANVFFSAGKR